MHQSEKDLIKEIVSLELEVKNLEKHLLTMYRKIYTSHFSAPPQASSRAPINERDDILGAHGVHRCQSSLSQRSPCVFRSSSPLLTKAVDSYHSLPLSMLEMGTGLGSGPGATSNRSLAEHFSDKVSPNGLSEEMIKCISAIYHQLADPPLKNHGFFSSPISISSSFSERDIWGPQDGENSNRFEDCFSGERSFLSLTEIHGIRRDKQSLHSVEELLKKFRSLILKLEDVKIRKLKHDEKLAFWINVHNALVMHAHLVYGIPRSNLKRISLILKAAYNVGGYTISIDMIQSSILGCRLPRPGQVWIIKSPLKRSSVIWGLCISFELINVGSPDRIIFFPILWLQSLLFPRAKYKPGTYRKSYALEYPEPRLYFAVCSGCHSDPSVRVFTPNGVFQELEVAKEEYLQTNIRFQKGQKVLLPKIIDSFAKDSGLCSSGLLDMVEHYLVDYERINCKKIVWSPHNFTFRFQLSNELSEF